MAWIEFGKDAGRVIEALDNKALEAVIRDYSLRIDNLGVTLNNGRATVSGKAHNQADREKAVLAAGNVVGVTAVEDRMISLERDEPAQFHMLEEGDTLSTLAARVYGVMRLSETILEANRPLVASADEVKPGHVVRVPVVSPPTHRVKKGETLGTIAKYWYGDPRKHSAVLFANRKLEIEDPNNLVPGIHLVIPARGPAVFGYQAVVDTE